MKKLKECPECLLQNWHAATKCERCGYDFLKALPPRSVPSPFPYMGHKGKPADDVWEVFGPASVFVDPFLGSAATLRHRPNRRMVCVANDAFGMIANFFRAVKYAPDRVAAEYPLMAHEADLVSWRNWIVGRLEGFRKKLFADPHWCDPKIAAVWAHGQCNWIGCNYCWRKEGGKGRCIHLGRPSGVERRKPLMAVTGMDKAASVSAYLHRLRAALVGCKFACGPWQRVCVKAVLDPDRTAALFLDPPYREARGGYFFGPYDPTLSRKVALWAVLAARRFPRLKVAVCEYSGVLDDVMPGDWIVYKWLHHRGYNKGHKNAWRERIYFSPNCRRLDDLDVLRLVR